MIYYKVCYYDGDNRLGGHILEGFQLKSVKSFVDPYFTLFNLKIVNVRFEVIYNPDSLKENLETHLVEVS